MPPRISVVLPVYNGEHFINEAVRSVLGQSFKDFELLVIDDGSTDRTSSILSTFQDPRLRVISNSQNQQLIRSLNQGIALSQGEFVARMDADDIAFPDRFEKQVRFLDANPDVDAVGSNIIVFEGRPESGTELMPPPQTPTQIHWELLRVSCLYHPTVLMRRRVFETEPAYNIDYPHSEDYELWLRLSRRFKLANLAEPLLYYRRHPSSISSQNGVIQRELSERALSIEIERRIGIRTSRNVTSLLMAPNRLPDASDINELRRVLPLLFQESLAQKDLTPVDRHFIQMSAMATIARLLRHAVVRKQSYILPLLSLVFLEMKFGPGSFARFPSFLARMYRAKLTGGR